LSNKYYYHRDYHIVSSRFQPSYFAFQDEWLSLRIGSIAIVVLYKETGCRASNAMLSVLEKLTYNFPGIITFGIMPIEPYLSFVQQCQAKRTRITHSCTIISYVVS